MGPKAVTGSELQAELDAERAGRPFLVYRDIAEQHLIRTLDGPLWIGRRDTADLCLSWDKQVSGIHAQLEPSGGEWTLVDDGLSTNGSFVNGEPIAGRRRLFDGDMIRVGKTVLLFRAPGGSGSRTIPATEQVIAASLTDTQKRVLVALCRPLKEPQGTPATNKDIAAEVFLGVDAVKVHLRALAAKFGVEDLPQNQKRSVLAQRALDSGMIALRDL